MDSGWFEVVTGVRQGCLLSPILFALAIDWVLKKATKDKGIQWLEGQQLSDLDFADDIAALAETTRDLPSLVSEIGTSAASISLNISAQKTKNMLAGTHPPPTSVYIDQTEVEVVDNFTYLGSSINSNENMDKELETVEWEKLQPHSISLAKSGEVRNSHSKQRCGSITAMYCPTSCTAVKLGT